MKKFSIILLTTLSIFFIRYILLQIHTKRNLEKNNITSSISRMYQIAFAIREKIRNSDVDIEDIDLYDIAKNFNYNEFFISPLTPYKERKKIITFLNQVNPVNSHITRKDFYSICSYYLTFDKKKMLIKITDKYIRKTGMSVILKKEKENWHILCPP